MLPSVSLQKLDLVGLRTSAVPDGWGPAGCDMRKPVCCTASKQRTAYRPATCHPQGFRGRTALRPAQSSANLARTRVATCLECRNNDSLFNQFVSEQQELFRNRQSEVFGRLQIDAKSEARWLDDGQVGRLFPSQHAGRIDSRLPVHLIGVSTVAY